MEQTLKRVIKLENEIKVDSLHSLNAIKIEVQHDKGGYSWGTGEYHKTGIKVDVTPIKQEERSWSVLYDGKKEHQRFFVFVKDCGRKSPKKMQQVADCVLPLSEKIVELFLAGNYCGVADLIVNSCKDVK